MEFIVHLNTSRSLATETQLEKYRYALEEIKRVDRDQFLLEPYAGYVDKEFCDDYRADGKWAMMMFAQNFTQVDRLCDVRCRYDPSQVAVTPCSFDFCYCHERKNRYVNTIY